MKTSRLLAVFERDLRKWARDRRGIVWAIAAALLLPIFGYVLGGEFRDLPIGIVGEPAGVPEGFVVQEYADLDAASAEIVNGRIYAVVTQKDVYVDNANPPIAAYIVGAFQRSGLEIKPFWDQDYEYIHFFLPAVIAVTIFMNAYQGGGMPIVQDKERGVIAKYLVTPVTRTEFLLGNLLGGFVKSLAPALVSLGIAVLTLGDMYTGGGAGIVSIFALMIISTFGFLGLSVWLALRFNYSLYYTLGVLLNMLVMGLSGLFYPIESLPVVMQFIARLNPMTFSIHAARIILMKNGSLLDLPLDLICLSIFSVGMFALGVLSLRSYSLETQ